MDRHIVLCGFARSGTTLLYNMLRNTVEGFEFFDSETPAEQSLNRAGSRITKRPKDHFAYEAIMNKAKVKVDFIFCVRDPRSLITSYHKSVPNDYFQGCEKMYFVPSGGAPVLADPGVRPTYENYVRLKDRMFTVRYEELLSDPDKVQEEMEQCLGLEFNGKIGDFGKKQEVIPEALSEQLNGIRPVDKTRIDAWRDHPERIKEEFHNNWIMFRMLKELGYEKDDEWIKNL